MLVAKACLTNCTIQPLVGLIVFITSSYSFHPSTEVPSRVEDITVNPDQKTITWAAPAEPNGIIVGYRVTYWELRRRDTAEEINTTTEVFPYINFSKCSTA